MPSNLFRRPAILAALSASLGCSCFPAMAANFPLDGAGNDGGARSKSLAQSEARLMPWVKSHPDDENTRFMLAQVLSWDGKTAEAVAEYNVLLQRRPRNVDYLLGKSQALVWADPSMQNPEEAIQLLDAARQEDAMRNGGKPNYWELYRTELMALDQAGDQPRKNALLAKVEKWFPRSDWEPFLPKPAPPPVPVVPMETPPAGPAPIMNAAVLKSANSLITAGKLDQAESVLKDWLKDHGDDTEARFRLAKVLGWENRLDESMSQYDELLQDDPKNPDYLFGKALDLDWSGKPDQAIVLLKQAQQAKTHDMGIDQLLGKLEAAQAGNGSATGSAYTTSTTVVPASVPGTTTSTTTSTTTVSEPVTPSNGTPSNGTGATAAQSPSTTTTTTTDVAVAQPATPAATADQTNWAAIQQAITDMRFADAETMLRTWLQSHPKDDNARFTLAQVLTWQGKTVEASSIFDELLAKSPNDPDYLLGKALALMRTKQKDQVAESINLLERARQQAPRYEDVYRAERQAFGILHDQKDVENVRQEAYAQFHTAEWAPPIAGGPAPSTPLEAEVGGSYESLTNGFANWWSEYVAVSKGLGSRSAIAAQFDDFHRYSEEDQQYTLGYYFPLAPKWEGFLQATGSPQAHFTPQWSLLGQVQYALTHKLFANVGYDRARYHGADVNIEHVGLDYYFQTFLLTDVLTSGGPEGSSQGVSDRVQLTKYYGHTAKSGESSSIAGGFSGGQEVDNLGPGRGVLVSNVYSLYMTGRHWFKPLWAFTYNLDWTHQGSVYDRTGLTLGIRRIL